MVRGAFDAVASTMATMFILCVIFVPLGIWKLIEIIIWIVKHISISMV